MADWLDSIELNRGDRVWVRRDNMIEELPSLDLDFDLDGDVVFMPVDEITTDRPLHGTNRGGVTSPPVQVRGRGNRATPAPLYTSPLLLDESPDPSEHTPVTFDMGLMPAVWSDDEPTEVGIDDPQAAIARFRASMDLAEFEEDAPSTELVPREMAIAAVRRAQAAPAPVLEISTNWVVQHRDSGFAPETSVSLVLDVDDLFVSEIDEEISLTLDLDPDWLVLQEPVRPAVPNNRRSVPHLRTPPPAPARPPAPLRAPPLRSRLADRAPAPQSARPLRSTVPTFLRTAVPQQAGLPTWFVNTATFVSGVAVGVAAASTIVFLSAAAALLA